MAEHKFLLVQSFHTAYAVVPQESGRENQRYISSETGEEYQQPVPNVTIAVPPRERKRAHRVITKLQLNTNANNSGKGAFCHFFDI